jgi:hypothetical protein
MPFEPIRTDEKIESQVKPPRDMDTHMLVGCWGFAATSLVTYALAVWPHFVFHQVHLKATLGLCFALGLIPAGVAGAMASRKWGLAAAAGFLGGSMATGVFLFLRLQQAHIIKDATQAPQPDYPESWVWIIPLAWTLVCLLLGLAATRREEFETEARPPKRP